MTLSRISPWSFESPKNKWNSGQWNSAHDSVQNIVGAPTWFNKAALSYSFTCYQYELVTKIFFAI